MKIKKLKIEGYKNLEIELEHNSDAIAVIGNNGSGKSNLLESLSYIFRSLYNEGESVSFDYFVEYQNSRNETIKIEKEKSKLTFHRDDEPLVSIKDYLPKKLIAIYSGEEDRLWRKCFKPFYDDFIKDINKTQKEGILYSQTPQMLYLNKFYWHISLLSLALSDLDDNKKFIKEVLGINKIDKIKFDFEKEEYKNYSNSPTLQFIKRIDGKSEYTVAELKKIFEKEGYIPDDVYRHLYLAFTPKDSKIISNITIKYDQHLTIEDLSEGEKKLLLVKAAFEFAEQEDSLFVLDEPDAHVHINNKEQISKIIEPYKTNRQIILTTHSPTITQAINESELFMIHNGKVIEKKKQEIISDITGEFWNKHQQNAFLASEKKLFLLVEGKHDKIHILNAYDKLKDEFPNLDFEIYSLGSESKIHPFLLGLFEARLENGKSYVAIYDNDKPGQNSLGKFEKEVDNCGYRKGLKVEPEKREWNNNFFAFTLVKPEAFTEDCTVESMYNPDKYEEAYKEALNKSLGHFGNKSIDKINKGIKDTSKNILADNSKDFEKEDFKNFRPIFNLIAKIIGQEVVEAENNTTPELFNFNNAKGNFNEEDNSFTLLNGSRINKEYTPSTKQEYKDSRNALIETLNHSEDGGEIVIEQDYKFDSPSGAAKFVNGGNRNGWNCWTDKDGKTLNERFRK